MAGVNPCGACVDVGRYPFTETRTDFWADSDEPVTLVWFPCAPGAPDLGTPTYLLNGEWEQNQADALGNPQGWFGVPPKDNRQKAKPNAIGRHHCGTDAEWLNGSHYDPLAPPVRYRADGLPECCTPMLEGRGGAVGGGVGDVTYTGPAGSYGGGVGGGGNPVQWSPYIYSRGGGVGDGLGVVQWSPFIRSTGGGVGAFTGNVQWSAAILGTGGGVGSGTGTVSITEPSTGGGVGDGTGDVEWSVETPSTGGGVGDGTGDVTWTPPGPGPTCATAYAMTDNVPYSASIPAMEERWFVLSAATGSTINVEVSSSVGAVITTVYSGTCAGLTTLAIFLGDDVSSTGGQTTPDTFYVACGAPIGATTFDVKMWMT